MTATATLSFAPQMRVEASADPAASTNVRRDDAMMLLGCSAPILSGRRLWVATDLGPVGNRPQLDKLLHKHTECYGPNVWPLGVVEQQDVVVLVLQGVFDGRPNLLVDIAGDPLLAEFFALIRQHETVVHPGR